MLIQRALSRLALSTLVVPCIGALFALRVPKVRAGFTIVKLKAMGSLGGVGWDDLFKMVRSGAHFNLPALAESPNPYAAIRNPFTSPADLSSGSEDFRARCEICHGAEGVGGPGDPSLQHRHMAQGSNDCALFKTMSQGDRGTSMPA